MERVYLKSAKNLQGVKTILDEIKKKRVRKRTIKELAQQLQPLWKNADTGEALSLRWCGKYIVSHLHNERLWLNMSSMGQGSRAQRETRDRVCERFNQYLTALDYEEAERRAIFVNLAHYNPEVRYGHENHWRSS